MVIDNCKAATRNQHSKTLVGEKGSTGGRPRKEQLRHDQNAKEQGPGDAQYPHQAGGWPILPFPSEIHNVVPPA